MPVVKYRLDPSRVMKTSKSENAEFTVAPRFSGSLQGVSLGPECRGVRFNAGADGRSTDSVAQPDTSDAASMQAGMNRRIGYLVNERLGIINWSLERPDS